MPHSAKNGSFRVYFSDSTPDFPPKCRHFGHLFAWGLHLFGLKTIETLTLNRFYPYSASPKSKIQNWKGWEDIQEYGINKQEWLQQFLELPEGIPSPDTFRRVFERIKPKELEKCFQK